LGNCLFSSFDFIICSQLIEHVDDTLLLLEIKRLLSKRGLAYISTVTKKWYGMYFYFRDGVFRLDPTHVKEYRSANEFMDLVSNSGFDIVEAKSQRVMFPVLDLIIRSFIKFGIAHPGANFYMKHKLQKARKFQIPVIGYNILETLVKRK
jgi:SAM-dependent methyltransferase